MYYLARNVYVDVAAFDNFYNESSNDIIVPILIKTDIDKSLNTPYIEVYIAKTSDEDCLSEGFTYERCSFIGNVQFELDNVVSINECILGSDPFDVQYILDLMCKYKFSEKDASSINQDSIYEGFEDILTILKNVKKKRKNKE